LFNHSLGLRKIPVNGTFVRGVKAVAGPFARRAGSLSSP
jgi:hypothetical protein